MKYDNDNYIIVSKMKSTFKDAGVTMKAISRKTNIPYQRLNRIFNDGTKLNAGEFLNLCNVLDIPVETFIDSNDIKNTG